MLTAALTLTVITTVLPASDEPRALRPVPFTDVRFTDQFWAPRQRVTREKTLWHNLEQCETTGRVENLRKAGTHQKGKYEGYFFNDSDVYKVIEGAAYQLALGKDPRLDARLDELIAIIAAAQEPDGYLDAFYTLTGLENRWTDEKDKHETYVAGHLIEAAVAHHQATGKRTLLDVAIKLADHIDSVFGPGKRAEAPGHQEIELALVKLWRLTGEERYFKLAQFFLDCRGVPRPTKQAPQGQIYGEYCQDHLPVREHDAVVGHAVRAMYLYSAVADVAAVTGDRGQLDAMQRVWEDLTQKKLYVTGGIGPSGSNEGFTVAYDLPNETAYAESCAAIGLAFWSHRLALLHADASYFDVFERALYNGILSSISLEGDRYFYVNPLASKGGHHRQPWFGCACCPPNILRFISSLGGYAYGADDNSVYVNLYAGGDAKIKLKDATASVTQTTQYPWDGRVRVTVQTDAPVKDGAVFLRIPGWCRGATWKVNGENSGAYELHRGYVRVPLSENTTTIDLEMPMPVARVYAHPSIKANIGRISLQRGPIVYCLEQVDNPAGVLRLAIPVNISFSDVHTPDLLGGVTVIKARALLADSKPWNPDVLYTLSGPPQIVNFVAVPYYAWDNRQPGEMTVWVPESTSLLIQPPPPDPAPSASHHWTGDSPMALCDGKLPTGSADGQVPRLTFWPHKGTQEWVQYDFRKPRKISSVGVYFFDDSGRGGGCKLPASWRVLYRDADAWKPVENEAPTESKADRFNTARFKSVSTSGLRIEMGLQEGFSAGILEWTAE